MAEPDLARLLDRSRFEGLTLSDLVAARDRLDAERQAQEVRLHAQLDSEEAWLDRQAALEEVFRSASAELDSRITLLVRAAESTRLAADDLQGLGELWALVRDRGLLEEILARAGPRSSLAGGDGRKTEHEQAVRELAECEAEITLRLAESNLGSAGRDLDERLAEELVRAVYRRFLPIEGDATAGA